MEAVPIALHWSTACRRTPNSAVPDQLLGSGYCNPAQAPCAGSSPCWSTLMIAARSRHQGGVNAALANGAVRFVADAVDAATDTCGEKGASHRIWARTPRARARRPRPGTVRLLP